MTAIDPERDTTDLLRRARAHLRAGRTAHAEALAEVALVWDADSDEALAILGHTALLRGDHARAAGLLGPAVAKREDAARLLDLGRALVGMDRRQDAATAFRRAADLAPADGGIANDLGVVLAELGRIDEAEAAFRHAMTLPGRPTEARNNLATALRQLGRAEEAAALSALPPQDAAALDAQAEAAVAEGRYDDAFAAGAAAIAARPDDAEPRRRHAHRLQIAGRLAEAEAELRAALALAPGAPAVHADLGWVVRRAGRLEEAIALLSAAAERWPNEARVLNSLAIAVLNVGRAEEALALLGHAVACDPVDAEVQHNRAMALLRLGRFAEGWEAYEWRWRMGQGRAVHRAFPVPLWGGEALDGRTILLHAEQGLGDTLQFSALCAAGGCARRTGGAGGAGGPGSGCRGAAGGDGAGVGRRSVARVRPALPAAEPAARIRHDGGDDPAGTLPDRRAGAGRGVARAAGGRRGQGWCGQ